MLVNVPNILELVEECNQRNGSHCSINGQEGAEQRVRRQISKRASGGKESAEQPGDAYWVERGGGALSGRK